MYVPIDIFSAEIKDNLKLSKILVRDTEEIYYKVFPMCVFWEQ